MNLEPEALATAAPEGITSDGDETAFRAIVSAAISLKRIADALSAQGAHDMGRAFVDGLAGASLGHGHSDFREIGRAFGRGVASAVSAKWDGQNVDRSA